MNISIRRPLAFILTLTLCFSMFSISAFGATAKTASLSAVKGTVSVYKSGGAKAFSAYNGMKVKAGDSIVTKAKSSVTVTVDKKVMVIGANAKVNIDELWGNSKALGSSVTVVKGSVLNSVGDKLNTNSKDEIKTPNTVACVRGTEFIIGYDPETGTQMKVIGGTVEVTFDKADASAPGATVAVDSTGVISGDVIPAAMQNSLNVDLSKVDSQILTAIKENPALVNNNAEIIKEVEKAQETQAKQEQAAAQPAQSSSSSSGSSSSSSVAPDVVFSSGNAIDIKIVAPTSGATTFLTSPVEKKLHIPDTSEYDIQESNVSASDIMYDDSDYPDGYFNVKVALKTRNNNRFPDNTTVTVNGSDRNVTNQAFGLENFSDFSWGKGYSWMRWFGFGWKNTLSFDVKVPVGLPSDREFSIVDKSADTEAPTLDPNTISLENGRKGIWINTSSSAATATFYDFGVFEAKKLLDEGELVSGDAIRFSDVEGTTNRISEVSLDRSRGIGRAGMTLGENILSTAAVTITGGETQVYFYNDLYSLTVNKGKIEVQHAVVKDLTVKSGNVDVWYSVGGNVDILGDAATATVMVRGNVGGDVTFVDSDNGYSGTADVWGNVGGNIYMSDAAAVTVGGIDGNLFFEQDAYVTYGGVTTSDGTTSTAGVAIGYWDGTNNIISSGAIEINDGVISFQNPTSSGTADSIEWGVWNEIDNEFVQVATITVEIASPGDTEFKSIVIKVIP